MVYSLVPNAGQSLGQTRDAIRENFSTLQTAFNTDHVDLDSSGQGHHAKVDFPEGTAPTVAADHVVMYAKDTNSRPTIWMRQENNGTEIQLTGPDPTIATNGKTFLPGGLLFQWGTTTVANGGTITFTTAFSGTPYSVVATGDGSPTASSVLLAGIRSKSAANFVVSLVLNGDTGETTPRPVNWMAIGPI